MSNPIREIDNRPIGAKVENIEWNNSLTLQEIIGSNINTQSSIADKIQQLNYDIAQLQNLITNLSTDNTALSEQLTALNTKIGNINFTDIQSNFTNLSNRYIPISKIKWENSPFRTLQNVLGNLDNMPAESFRDWLEQLSRIVSLSTPLVWKKISSN